MSIAHLRSYLKSINKLPLASIAPPLMQTNQKYIYMTKKKIVSEGNERSQSRKKNGGIILSLKMVLGALFPGFIFCFSCGFFYLFNVTCERQHFHIESEPYFMYEAKLY